jgi:hypothetical protein
MKKMATQILTALLLATAMASCSTPVLEPTTNESVPLETDLLNGETGNASDLVGDGSTDGDASLQATAKPCFTYKVKTEYFKGSKGDLGGTMYGYIRVKKSPTCYETLKVSFEGANTGKNTPALKRITAQFDEIMYPETGDTYYAYFDISTGRNLPPGKYGLAFRVKGGNVNKAVTLVKLTILPGSAN